MPPTISTAHDEREAGSRWTSSSYAGPAGLKAEAGADTKSGVVDGQSADAGDRAKDRVSELKEIVEGVGSLEGGEVIEQAAATLFKGDARECVVDGMTLPAG